MEFNEVFADVPRSDHGFDRSTFAAKVLDPGPQPPAIWDVRTPRDLVPLHRLLITQAAEIAGGAAAAPRLRYWTEAAGTVASLHFSWRVRLHDVGARKDLRDAADEAVRAVLTALRDDEPDPSGHLNLATGWLEQLRMSAVARRSLARRLLGRR